MISGATYSGVPQKVHVFFPNPIFFAKPKSTCKCRRIASELSKRRNFSHALGFSWSEAKQKEDFLVGVLLQPKHCGLFKNQTTALTFLMIYPSLCQEKILVREEEQMTMLNTSWRCNSHKLGLTFFLFFFFWKSLCKELFGLNTFWNFQWKVQVSLLIKEWCSKINSSENTAVHWWAQLTTYSTDIACYRQSRKMRLHREPKPSFGAWAELRLIGLVYL